MTLALLRELRAARLAYDAACELCPHWDYESDGGGHDCCLEVAEARLRLRRAQRARIASVRVGDAP